MSRIRYYDEQMARAVLASVLDLGSTNSGNRALGDTFSTLLADGVQAIGAAIADTATELCRRLVDYNFGPDEPVPTIVASDVKDDPQIIAGTIGSLVSAGVITPGPELEAYVREAYGLPPAPGGMVGFENEPDPEAPPVEAEPEQVAAAGGLDRNRGNAENLRRAYLTGALAARIRWNSSGDWSRCVAIAAKHMTKRQAEGFCANRHKEATGQWPGKGRVHAAEGDPYREPTPAERAAGIDPAAIDEDHDALVALAEAAVAAAVAAWVAASAAALSAAVGGGLLALARVTLDLAPEGVAEALRGAMGLARRAGVEQALGEARRAGGPRINPDNAPDGGAAEEDAEWADLLAERGAGAFEAMAKRAAQQADPDAIEQALEDAARGPWFDALVYDAINYAMLGGRLQAMQHVIDATPGTTWTVFHSALRDRSSCSACLEHDGTQYPDIVAALVDFGLGRYRACEGWSRCRCILAASPIGPLQQGDPAFFRGPL
nr:DUF935 family protein [Kineosporia babensis]